MTFNTSIIGQSFGPFTFEYTWKDVALYALASGATTSELDLLLETRGPKVLPTYSAVIAFEALFATVSRFGGDATRLVHGGQRCTTHQPLPHEGRFDTTCKVVDLFDKGKGALAIFLAETTSPDGQIIATTEWSMFYRQQGGFAGSAVAGDRGASADAARPSESSDASSLSPSSTSMGSSSPSSSAHAQIAMPTNETQALLYRIASGDWNPIHSEPALASLVGFERPILHGLCTLAYAARAVVQAFCAGDSNRLTSIEGRFSKPVYPGQTIIADLVETAPRTCDYTMAVGDALVITHGRASYE